MMKHLLGIRHVGSGEIGCGQVVEIITEALRMIPFFQQRKTPPPTDAMQKDPSPRKVIAVFQERSTRTQSSSLAAATGVGYAIGPTIGDESSLGKGETVMNTVRMLNQYGATGVIVRSAVEGIGMHLAQCIERAEGGSWVRKDLSVVIGGSGTRSHPTQVLLDATTLVLRRLKVRSLDDCSKLEEVLSRTDATAYLAQVITETLTTLRIAFVGDLLHSRVVHDWVHLARLFKFEIAFVAPSILQIEDWCLDGIRFHRFESIDDVVEFPFIYTIRLQKERLEKTLPAHEVAALILQYQITDEYLRRSKGEILDALPLDQVTPMIHPSIWNHPRVIMYMQSAVGIPLRMAVWRLCDAGRREQFPILGIPRFKLSAEHIIREQKLADHLKLMNKKYRGKEMFASNVNDGVVIDRIPRGYVGHIHHINELAGVYRDGCGPILPSERFPSASMGTKDVLFMHGVVIPPWLMTIYTLIAPQVRISVMNAKRETDGGMGYQRIEPPLPKVVQRFVRCQNAMCITNLDPEATPYSYVYGTKEEPHLECAYCEQRIDRESILGLIA